LEHAPSFQQSLIISEAGIAGSKSSFTKERWEPSISVIVTVDLLFDFTVNVHGPC